MKVSVVIPNYNGSRFLNDCLQTLKTQTYSDFETILVDNASDDRSIELARGIIPDIKCIELSQNRGFSAAVNQGIRNSGGEYIVLLNNDTVLTETWLEKLVLSIEKYTDAFACASKMIQYYDQNSLDNVGDSLTVFGWAYQEGFGQSKDLYNTDREIFSCCAGAAIYRKKVFEEIGYFDENFFAYLEDVDIGYRARIAGYSNYYCSDAIIYHIGSATTGNGYNSFKVKLSARNNVYMLYKNMPFFQLLLNAPFLFIGHVFKLRFYKKIGFDKEYLEGLREGFSGRNNIARADFQKTRFIDFVLIEKWLIQLGLVYGIRKVRKALRL